ncbi:hypothetical protein CAL7716_082960 [Calothrix sp. PCC 7716]|nr:hypothetical protein CAL7716_082960 [Calothrix sp. PCC 7716]
MPNLTYTGNLLPNKCYVVGTMKSLLQSKQRRGIAFLVVRELTNLTVIERSAKGTGFDYWLGALEPDEELPFQNRVRLEVSGIRSGDSSRVKARVKQKKEQTKPSDGQYPAYVIVVEFSTPISTFAIK